MAVVGDAYIVVRAITNRVKPEIEKAFSGLDRTARITGERTGREFDEGVKKNIKNPLFSKKFLDEADKARKRFQSLVQVGYFLGPLITSLIGGIGSLAAGLVVLSTALSRAAPAGIVLVSSLAALAQAAITLKLAFKGVFEAVGAKETSRGANNARAIEKALDRLLEKRAELEAFEASIFEKNLERRRQLVDVEDRYADAIIGLERQQRAFIKVQQANIDAQQAVTKAREDAREAIQQLRFELEGGAISEKKARLAFEKARESLQRVQDLPPNSRARQEAELAFAEAELNLRKAIDRNKDLQKEEAESTRRGVEGSEAVVNAKQRAVDANQAEADAIVDLAQAQRDFEKTTQDTIRSRQALSQENFDKQIAADRAKLEKEIDDAEKDLEDLKKKSGGGPSALQQALKDLSPEARKFVEFLRGPMKDSLKDLRAEAGAELFPKLETALTNIKDNLFKPLEPLVRRTGGVLGDVAVELSNVVTEGENIERLERIWGSGDKLIGNFGAALGNVYELLLILLDAARPLAEEFGQWIEDLTGGWASDADKNFETIQTRFEEAGEIVKTFAEIFGNLFDGFASIGDAVTTEGGGLDILLGYFVESSENFAKLMDQMEGDGSLAKYFADATTNATKILSLLGAIVGAFFKLGDDEGIGIFADKLSEAVGIFAGAGEGLTGALPALGDLIIAFAELTAVFTDTGALTTFFEILTTALNVVVDIAGSDLAKQSSQYLQQYSQLVELSVLLAKLVDLLSKFLLETLSMLEESVKVYSVKKVCSKKLARKLSAN